VAANEAGVLRQDLGCGLDHATLGAADVGDDGPSRQGRGDVSQVLPEQPDRRT
jgi:hypothetical protein